VICCYCKRAEDKTLNEERMFKVELRPYGPNGVPICFECAMRPDRKRETKRQFTGRLAFAGDVALLTEAGPVAAPKALRSLIDAVPTGLPGSSRGEDAAPPTMKEE
jgi:hypothetical protein